MMNQLEMDQSTIEKTMQTQQPHTTTTIITPHETETSPITKSTRKRRRTSRTLETTKVQPPPKSLPPTQKELISTYEGSNGSYGAMFDIRTSPSSSIRISSLDIHTNAEESCDVQVYILQAFNTSHAGHEQDPQKWNLIQNDTIPCMGFYKRTHIPLPPSSSSTPSLIIGADTIQAFYIIMSQPFLRYTNTQNFGEVYTETDELKFYEGTGVGDAWGGEDGGFLYRPRVWNGAIQYEVLVPPPKRCEESGVLETGYTSSVASYGNMFNVVNKGGGSVVIQGMSLYSEQKVELEYEVYTKRGAYWEDGGMEVELGNSQIWELIASGTVMGAGSGVGTPIPSLHFERTSEEGSRTIPPNAIQGFYVTFTTTAMSYEQTTSLQVGDVLVENEDIQVQVGVGVAEYPYQTSFYEQRMWRGKIDYVVLDSTCAPTSSPVVVVNDTDPPTKFPTSSPTKIPTAMPTVQTSTPTSSPITSAPTWECSTPSSLTTTSIGGTGAYGNMFDVYTPSNTPIIIKSLSLLIEKKGVNVRVLVYTKPGTFLNHELNLNQEWEIICDALVTSSPTRDFTTIPFEEFTSVKMEAKERRAFYVTLDVSSLLYTKQNDYVEEGGGVEKIVVEDDYLRVLEGNGVGTFPLFVGGSGSSSSAGSSPGSVMKNVYLPRVWNGIVNYEVATDCNTMQQEEVVQEVEGGVMVPSPAPLGDEPTSGGGTGVVNFGGGGGPPVTTSPTPIPLITTRITYMFHVHYSPNTIPLLSTLLNDMDGKVGEAIDSLFGTDSLLEAYRTFRGLEVVGVDSREELENVPYECTPKTNSNTCKTIQTILTLTHTPALTSDEVSYDFLRLRDTITSSLNSNSDDLYTVTYVGEQSVEARTVIVLKGVPPKKMGEEERVYFEGIAKEFLSGDFEGGAKILGVQVEQQKLEEEDGGLDDVEYSAFLGRSRAHSSSSSSSSFFPLWGGDNRRRRRLQTSSSSASASIGLVTTVTGQYQPPPEINFPSLVQDSIDNGGDELVDNLVNSGGGAGAEYFEKVRSLEVIRPPPTMSPTSIGDVENEISSGGGAPIAAIIGGVIGALALIFCLCFFLKRRKKMKEKCVMESEIKNVRNREGVLQRVPSLRGGDIRMTHSDEDELYMPQMPLKKGGRDDLTTSTATNSTRRLSLESYTPSQGGGGGGGHEDVSDRYYRRNSNGTHPSGVYSLERGQSATDVFEEQYGGAEEEEEEVTITSAPPFMEVGDGVQRMQRCDDDQTALTWDSSMKFAKTMPGIPNKRFSVPPRQNMRSMEDQYEEMIRRKTAQNAAETGGPRVQPVGPGRLSPGGGGVKSRVSGATMNDLEEDYARKMEDNRVSTIYDLERNYAKKMEMEDDSYGRGVNTRSMGSLAPP